MADITFKPMAALKKFLSTPDQPVSTQEMGDFWKSLSEQEKEDFKAYAEEHLKS